MTGVIHYKTTRGSGASLGQVTEEVRPMSVTETIALLMLVLAAITLGTQLKK